VNGQPFCGPTDMTKLLLLFFLLASPPDEAQMVRDIQASHIQANVPAEADFATFLRRDLAAYFAKDRKGKSIKVDYELLRDGPTQSGISYPKYYAWVRINGGKSDQDRGAVRVAAIERKRFDVTSFASERDIRADPGALALVFPGAVCESIKSRLGISR
jgi:hypothetical protein